MGLFSSKKVRTVTVSSVANRVIEDRLVPNSLKTGFTKGILKGDQLIEYVMEELVDSVGMKAERMYTFGKKSYLNGLPSSAIRTTTEGVSLVKAAIESTVGYSIDIEYYKYAPLNNIHYGWGVLVEDYGYNKVSNTLDVLSAQIGKTVYLDNMIMVIPVESLTSVDTISLNQWGTPPNAGLTPVRTVTTNVPYTPYMVSPVATYDFLSVTYVWLDDKSVLNKGELTIPVIATDDDHFYFQVKYGVKGSVPNKYWTYRDGSNIYPEVDDIFHSSEPTIGSFFPWGYVRFNGRAINDPSTREYKDNKKLLSYLGLNYEDLTYAISENPDKDSIEQAMVIMAIPPSTSNEIEKRYLFDFFKRLHTSVGELAIGNEVAWTVQDSKFQMALRVKGLKRSFLAGSVGTKGTYTAGSGALGSTITVPGYPDAEGNATSVEQAVSSPYHFYRRQVTSRVYEEIQVYGLEQTLYVYEGHSTSNILLIPIDHSISDEYSIAEREELYARSIHYLFNTKTVTEYSIKWYQQSWFKIVMIIIAIVVTIFYDWSGSALSAALMLGEYALAAEILLLIVLEAVVMSIVINAAMKLFVKLVGPEVAMVFAIVAMVYGGYTAIDAGSIAGAPWAQELLSLGSNLAKLSSETQLANSLAGISKEADIFSLEMNEKWTFLKAKEKELLEEDNFLSTLNIPGEDPSTFFYRTTHAGNIGIVSLDAIHVFADEALRLPEFKDSVSMFNTPSMS